MIFQRSTLTRRRRQAFHTSIESMEHRQLLTADVLGVTRGDGTWLLNTEPGVQTDPNPEIDARFGLVGDTYVVGNWFGEDDRMGVVRDHRDGFARWYLDSDGDPEHEAEFLFGLNDFIPVVGDWDGDGVSNMGSVELGADGFMRWHLDLDGDPEAEQIFLYGLNTDTPVVGDWNNDGVSDFGVYRSDANGFGHWLLDLDRDPAAEVDRLFGLAGDEPVTGDFDGNGTTDIAVARVEGAFKRWYLDTNNDNEPEPQRPIYGLSSDVAVAGNWRLPEADMTYGSRSVPAGGRVNFGVKLPGVIGNRTFRLNNRGNEPLSIDHKGTNGQGVRIQGDFELVDGLPTSLEPGAADAIVIRLKDNTRTGNRSGKLIVNTNDGNEQRYEIELFAAIETPEIHVDGHRSGRTVQLGQIVQGKDNIKRFRFNNKSRVPLTIGNTTHSAGIEIRRVLPGVIQRKATANLDLAVPTDRLGSYQGWVRVQNDDPNESDYLIKLKWTIVESRPEIEVNGIRDGQTQTINFGTAYAGNTARRKTFTVKNRGNDDLTTSVRVPNGYRIVEGLNSSIAPGAEDNFTVELRSENSVGTYNGEIRIDTNDRTNSVFNFRVSGLVDLLPPEINVIGIKDGERRPFEFGTTRVGQPAITKSFQIRNNGQKNLTISRVTVPNGFQIVSRPNSVRPGETKLLTVRLLTSQSRTRQGDIMIYNNDQDESVYNFRVRGVVLKRFQGPELEVRYNGRIVSSGALIDFGAIVGGAARSRQFQIYNRGDQTLTISNIQSVSGYTISGLSNGQQIAPNASRTVTLFATSALGAKLGTLSFNTNDSNVGLFELPLKAKRFEAIQRVGGSANGFREFDLFVSAAQVDKGIRIEVAPAHGRMPANGRVVVTFGQTRQTFSNLQVLNIRGTGAQTVIIETWIGGVNIRRR